MNKSIFNKLCKYEEKVIAMRENLEEILEKMQDSFDNHSDAWLESEKAEEAQNDLDNIDNIIQSLAEVEENIQEITSNF